MKRGDRFTDSERRLLIGLLIGGIVWAVLTARKGFDGFLIGIGLIIAILIA